MEKNWAEATRPLANVGYPNGCSNPKLQDVWLAED